MGQISTEFNTPGIVTFSYDSNGHRNAGTQSMQSRVAGVLHPQRLLGNGVVKTEPTTGTATTATTGFAYVYDEDGNLMGEYGTGGASRTGTAEYIWLPTSNCPMPLATVINCTLFAVHSDNLNTPRRLSNTAA